MKTISSLQNTKIKYIAKLHNNKFRKEHNQSIVEGQRAVKTFIESSIKITDIYITEKQQHIIKELNISNYNIITLIPNYIMERISVQKTPSGVLAIFDIPNNPDWKELSSGIVLLEVNSPGNIGALIRTSVAVGANTIVSINSTDPWSPKVIQSTAGNIALAKVFVTSWNELIKNKNNIDLYALVVKNGKSLKEKTYKNKSLLIIGNEAHGIDSKYICQSDKLITLPMPGGSESLNAAIAGSISLYIIHVYK